MVGSFIFKERGHSVSQVRCIRSNFPEGLTQSCAGHFLVCVCLHFSLYLSLSLSLYLHILYSGKVIHSMSQMSCIFSSWCNFPL